MDEPFPPLGPPPSPTGAWAWFGRVSHGAYGVLNRWFMVPAHRLGLGAWIATPIGGYMLMLRTRGRKTGRVRDVPLSYVIAHGSIWVLAGFGVRTQWYRNLLADPEIEVWLPGRILRCRSSEALDPAVRAAIIPRLARGVGLPGLLIGCNPWRTADERILELLSWVPLVKLEPIAGPIAAGPDDPRGLAWIWRQAVVLGIMVVAVRALRVRCRCRSR